MGITAQVFNLLGSGKGALCVYDPGGSIKQSDESFKFTRTAVDLCFASKDELSMSKGFFELFKITLSKLFCQRLDFEQVRVSGQYPSGLVKKKGPRQNEAKQM